MTRLEELQEMYNQFIRDRVVSEFKIGDIVRPHTNDLNNIDYVTTTGLYEITNIYYVNGVERIDIKNVEYDEEYYFEASSDFSKEG